MKESTGEVSMTMVTVVAVAVIGAILAILWDPIKDWIGSAFNGVKESTEGEYTTDINPWQGP